MLSQQSEDFQVGLARLFGSAFTWQRSCRTSFSVTVYVSARLAQSAERKALDLVVVGSSPTVGVCP